MASRVGGIKDRGGGFRVVVTDGDFRAHLAPGETLYVLPDYTVEEPVPMEDIPAILAKVEAYLKLKA